MYHLRFPTILIALTVIRGTACQFHVRNSSFFPDSSHYMERKVTVSHHGIEVFLSSVKQRKLEEDEGHLPVNVFPKSIQVKDHVGYLTPRSVEPEERIGERIVVSGDGIGGLRHRREAIDEQYFDDMLCSDDEIGDKNWKSSLIQVWCHVGCRNNLINSCEDSENETQNETKFNLDCVYEGVRNYFRNSDQATCYVNMTYNNITESERSQKCALDCIYDISKNYTQKFIEGGDLETGQLALNLTEEYVTGTRMWMKTFQFMRPESLISCFSCISLNVGDNDIIVLEKTRNLSLGIKGIYKMLHRKKDLVKEIEEIYSLGETHNYELDRLKIIESRLYVSSIEERRRDIDELRIILEKLNLTHVLINQSWSQELLSVNYWKIDEDRLRETYIHTARIVGQIKTYVVFQRYVEPVIFSIIFLIGLIGNSILLLIFFLHPEIRTTPNVMIINIVACDILCYVINIPIRYLILYKPNIIRLANTSCTIYIAVCLLLFHVSALSVLGFSFQRYHATLKKARLSATMTFRFLTTCVLMVWVVSVFLSITLAHDVEIRVTFCDKHDVSGVVTALGKYLYIGGILLLLLVLMFNCLTGMQLRKSIRDMPGEIEHQHVEKSRRKSYRLLNAIVLVLFVSYGPKLVFTLVLYWARIDVMEPVYQCLDRITFYLVFGYSCFNPIALYIASSNFRKLINIHLFRYKEDYEHCEE